MLTNQISANANFVDTKAGGEQNSLETQYKERNEVSTSFQSDPMFHVQKI